LDGANLGSAVTAAPYAVNWDTTGVSNGSHTLTAIATDGVGLKTTSAPVTITVNNTSTTTSTSGATVVWVDDSLPAGAIAAADGGDGWFWISSNPTPYSGALASQSNIGSGLHENYFYGAAATLSVQTGDTLFAFVYLDPSNLPSEIMLQWNDGSWEHRAYWGADLITYGADKTAGRYYMGPLPAAGQWVRLAVPASLVGLEGSTLNGMSFSLYGGRATWDNAGDASAASATTTTTTLTVSTNSPVIWVDDSLPAGALATADGGDGWFWISSNPTPYSGALASQSNIGSGLHEHYFYGATATLAVNTGDTLFAYVYLDPSNLPSEVMLQWNDGSWEHRAYWGADLITYGADKTAGRYYMGPLPAAGQWVQLAVPANAVGLEGSTLNGMSFTLYGGRAAWDYAGKAQ
ncbi:MAG: hypothetical protein KGS61_10625, partial [Verrucomicrobia bacterium]|nr:hypothetical protein [Verrucomicrobiota bacterium]